MVRYALLMNPSHNRIYFEKAAAIACLELEAIAAVCSIEISEIQEDKNGLPACITFITAERLAAVDVKAISAASAYYALFEVVEDSLLRPVIPEEFRSFPESLNQILKYKGKTNELFTRLMVNLAVAACKTGSKKPRLIDPMCGKGTTLYEGIVRGYDVVGIEINGQWVNEIQTYLLRYLKMGKYKHKAQKEKRSGAGGKKIADYFKLVTAATKEAFQNDAVQNVELFTADTRKADKIMKKSSCDILISDLPYGVQHGSKNVGGDALSRSPLELLKEAIPSWSYAMKNRGAVVLSYNEFTLKYKDIAKVLQDNGFTVLDEKPYFGYLHRVDQSINRNLIVAVKA